MKIYINTNSSRFYYKNMELKDKFATADFGDSEKCIARMNHALAHGWFKSKDEAIKQYDRVNSAVTLYYIENGSYIDLDNKEDFLRSIKSKYIYAEFLDKYLLDSEQKYFETVDGLKDYYSHYIETVNKNIDSYNRELEALNQKYLSIGMDIESTTDDDCNCGYECDCNSISIINGIVKVGNCTFSKRIEI